MERRLHLNLRFSNPIDFHGDDEAERTYLEEVEMARSKQAAPFAVAPRLHVETQRGTLGPGEPVTAADMIRDRNSRGEVIPPWRTLERLVDQGYVLSK